MQEEMQQQQQQATQRSLVDQAGQLASSPLADPQKNPALAEMYGGEQQQGNAPSKGGGQAPPSGE
jgi:hypothetical protein